MEFLVDVGLEQLHLDVGVGGAEPTEHHRQHRGRHALERADREPPGVAGAEPIEVVGERRHPCEEVASTAEELGTEGRELDGAWATRTIEHLLADRALERGDLLTDRRLRVAETFGCTSERALGRHRVERHEMAQFEVAEGRHEHQSS